MTQQTTFYPVVGGLDETTQAIAVAKGRCIAALNHESIQEGYGRIAGIERYDGQPSPTAVFLAQTDAEQAVIDRENARGLIGVVPGTGPVRGVQTFEGVRYAWRDNIDQTACIMYRSTTVGWEEVPLGYMVEFNSGGTYEIVPGDVIGGVTSGAPATVRKVIVLSGQWADGDAAGYLVIEPPGGTFQLEDIAVGAEANVATITVVPVAQSFPPGGDYEFEVHNFYAATSMRCFYGINQVGRGFEVDRDGYVTFIRSGMPADQDIPLSLYVHKSHLFFGFDQGQISHSVVGTPTLFDGILGAGTVGMGAPITGFCSAPGNALFIFTETKIGALYGQGIDDWTLEDLTDEGGAFRHTMQRGREVLYMDNHGVRGISAAREYGNFKAVTYTAAIERTLERKRANGVVPVASVIVKNKTQYRLFFSDGTGISIFFGRKYPECMSFSYGDIVVTSVTTTKEELGPERIFFGSENGYVYEMDVGTSLDGEAIEAYLQFPFDHEGMPLSLKKWHKVTFEMVAVPDTVIGISAEFDYAGVDQPGLGLTNLSVTGGGGGTWSIDMWGEFYWSSPHAGTAESWIDGQGQNMSLILVSTSAEQMPYIVQGVSKSFTVRGQRR